MNSKRLLITGAFGGMGQVCAELGAKAGYDLILADLTIAGLAELQGRLPTETLVEAFQLDVTDNSGVDTLVKAMASGGGIDAVIHTVGVTPTMTSWQRIVDIDLIASVKFLEALRPVINSGGAAVCISSSSGYMVPTHSEVEAILAEPLATDLFAKLDALAENPLTNTGLAYAYAKKALRYYVADFAMAWGREGKRLVSISPGLIATEAGNKENVVSQSFAMMKQAIALGRLGEPDEIAKVALFLISDQASFISGCDLLVDGGMIGSMGKARPS
ncbi:SDR family oxidoreductase [Halioxenophilus sp. WMMB6]|uniref:SDR family oxidoreductase n=1 Tax=Halioxenophilus sp. WMMB6 TaxID=3073815 RepID=UPI00295F0940|nr:SDR family oxidoreductase [Halioxenophilus sp. WMMB6]